MAKKIIKEKFLKVYEVVFGEMYQGEDMSNIFSKKVLAETAESAISEARFDQTSKEKEKYYIEEVRLIVIIK